MKTKVSMLVIDMLVVPMVPSPIFKKKILPFAEAHPIIMLTTLESERRYEFAIFSGKVLVRLKSPLSNQIARSLFSYEPAHVQERNEYLLSLSIFDQDNASVAIPRMPP